MTTCPAWTTTICAAASRPSTRRSTRRPRCWPATRSTRSPFELIGSEDTHPDPFARIELVAELARASGPAGMAGGQMMDIVAETRQFDLATVTRLQQLKTGALIGFTLEAGAIMGRVPPEGRTSLRGYAHDIGLAFQIADDLLDEEGDEAATGKALHKDAEAGKATFVSLLGPRARGSRRACWSIRRSPICAASGARPICCAPSPAMWWSAIDERAHGRLPGTFDPVTLGHMDIIRRGAKLVDRFIIGVTTNPSKSPMFSIDERLASVRREVADDRGPDRGGGVRRAADDLCRADGRDRHRAGAARGRRLRI
jgi:cytidyltransferase-like protein